MCCLNKNVRLCSLFMGEALNVLNNPCVLFGFYDISTFVGYLMPNSVFTFIKPKISK